MQERKEPNKGEQSDQGSRARWRKCERGSACSIGSPKKSYPERRRGHKIWVLYEGTCNQGRKGMIKFRFFIF